MIDPLSDINQYGKNLTIAQAVKFFEKKGLKISRAMIQNYIRDGLLPPPAGKRIYTRGHLAALVVIDRLKTVFEMNEIKAAILPHLDGEGMPLDFYYGLLDSLSKIEIESSVIDEAFRGENGLLVLMLRAAELKQIAVSKLNI